MSEPYRCPICYGRGEIEDDPFGYATTAKMPKVCHACGGRGIVWEPRASITVRQEDDNDKTKKGN